MRIPHASTLTVLLAAALALGAPARPALAGPADDDSRATRLTREGIELYRHGNSAAALERFDAAFALVPSPRLRFDRALAYRALGRTLEAARELAAFLRQPGDAPPASLKQARTLLAALDQHIGRLQIDSTVPAQVTVDGTLVGSTPLTARVMPGDHRVRITAPGHRGDQRTAHASAGTEQHIQVRLSPLPSQDPASPTGAPTQRLSSARPDLVAPRPVSPGRTETPLWRRWWVWTAVGAVALGSAAAVWAASSSSSSAPDSDLGTYYPVFH